MNADLLAGSAGYSQVDLLRTERQRFGKRFAGGCRECRRLKERIANCAKRLVCSHCGHRGGRMTPVPKLDPKTEKRERQNHGGAS